MPKNTHISVFLKKDLPFSRGLLLLPNKKYPHTLDKGFGV